MPQTDITPSVERKRRPAKKRKPVRTKTKKKSAVLEKRQLRRHVPEPTSQRAVKLAAHLIEFEKTTFASASALLRSINDQSDKAIRSAVSGASWMPKEGQKLVEEWQSTLRRSLKEFTKSVDKSFNLLGKYLERIQSEADKTEKL